jgi:hypothetical protein
MDDNPRVDNDPVHALAALCRQMLPLVKEAVHDWSEEQRSMFRQEELGAEALGELIENLKLVQDKIGREKHLYGHSETEERYRQLGDDALQRVHDTGMAD